MFSSIAIVGSGAIGLYYGGRLAEAGHDVRFLLRSDYDAIKKDGLRCESVHGDFHLPQVKAFRSAAEIGPVDLIVVAWKATSNHLLAEVLPPLLHENSQVVTLQNGMGNGESIAAITGPERVLAALCFVCINRISPGFIRHTAGGKMAIGEFAKGSPGRSQELAKMFAAAKIETVVERDVEETAWKKLIWNVPFNGLAIAEGGKTTDQLLADDSVTREIRCLMEEVLAAAASRGFTLDRSLIDWNIDRTRNMGAYRPSSLIDWQEGREVEVEAIWAEPLRRAESTGACLPHWRKLLERIRDACDQA